MSIKCISICIFNIECLRKQGDSLLCAIAAISIKYTVISLSHVHTDIISFKVGFDERKMQAKLVEIQVHQYSEYIFPHIMLNSQCWMEVFLCFSFVAWILSHAKTIRGHFVANNKAKTRYYQSYIQSYFLLLLPAPKCQNSVIQRY